MPCGTVVYRKTIELFQEICVSLEQSDFGYLKYFFSIPQSILSAGDLQFVTFVRSRNTAYVLQGASTVKTCSLVTVSITMKCCIEKLDWPFSVS